MTGSFGEYFLFYGLTEFYIFIMLWLEGIGPSCPRFFPLSSPGVLASDPASFHGDLIFKKTDFLLPYFHWWNKGATSVLGFWPIISLLSSSLSGDCFGLLYVQYITSLSIRSQSANICWSSFWPTFFTFSDRLAKVDLHYYSSF